MSSSIIKLQLGIFNVFFNLRLLQRLNVEIAPSAKLPYIAESITYDKSSYKAYREVYNVMYCIESKPYKTCFYTKNNQINYYRKWVYGDELFIPDIISGSYKAIKFKRLGIDVNDESSMLIKTGRGKWYVITRHESSGYLLIVDALSGTVFYKEKIKGDGNLYVDALYPIANKILPIIHVNRQNLCLRLFDIDNESLHTIITFDLRGIHRIVKLIGNNAEDIKDKLSHYRIGYIEGFDIQELEYLYDLYDKSFIYIKGVRFKFGFTVKYETKEEHSDHIDCKLHNFLWYLELDKGDLKCYLELSQVKLHWSDGDRNFYVSPNQSLKPVIRKYYISDGFSDIYLSQCLYKDQCYYIYNTPYGVGIIKAPKSNYVKLLSSKASLYRFEDYLILFLKSGYKELIIIDTKSKRVGYWICENCELYYITEYKLYYSKANNKLIFLSNDLQYLLAIDIDRLNFIFNSNKNFDCIETTGREDNTKYSLCETIYCLRLGELIAKLITRKRGVRILFTAVQMISCYIDDSSGTLYLSATYEVEKVRYMAVFSLTISYGKVNFNMLYHHPISRSYNRMARNIYYKLGVSKIFLHKFGESILGDLDIAYDKYKNRLVSIRYNRNSIRITAIKGNQVLRQILRQSIGSLYDMVSVKSTFSNLIAVRYYYIGDADLMLLFIKSGLHLVKSMTPIQF
jgi:hypothetical protein